PPSWSPVSLSYMFYALGGSPCSAFFFLNAPPTTALYSLSLHDALPIFASLASLFFCRSTALRQRPLRPQLKRDPLGTTGASLLEDRKSTRLNSSHGSISYAVFCLKKKKTTRRQCR